MPQKALVSSLPSGLNVVNMYRKETRNRGDIASAPSHYFPELRARPLELTGWKRTNENSLASWMSVFNNADLIIVGGGGLLEFEKHRDSIEFVMANAKAKKVIWGAGHNLMSAGSWAAIKPRYKMDYSGFDLVGVRDDGHSFDWVPCASCMSPALDKKYAIEKEFVYFVNKGLGDFEKYIPAGVDPAEVVFNFDGTTEEIIAELAKGETVVTSSFHGAYWAQLLGRKVIAIPTSSKFYDMRFPVPLSHPRDWRRYIKLARRYPEALKASREANIAFANKVIQLVKP